MTATSSQELPAARRAGLRERALPPRVVRLHVARVLEPPPPQVLHSRHQECRPRAIRGFARKASAATSPRYREQQDWVRGSTLTRTVGYRGNPSAVLRVPGNSFLTGRLRAVRLTLCDIETPVGDRGLCTTGVKAVVVCPTAGFSAGLGPYVESSLSKNER
jgi:hypothetical protein